MLPTIRQISSKTVLRIIAFLTFLPIVEAAVIFDSGTVTFSPTGSQFGRLFRDGLSSTWGEQKVFPGVTGAPTARAYQSFTVNAGPYPFLQIQLDNPNAALFAAAYRNSFTPANTAPNYGLSVNYLGDAGNSQPFGNPSFFQLLVAPNSTVVIPINEVNPGGGTGTTFSLLVEGFYNADFSEVPEPSSTFLLLSGLALFGMRLRMSKGTHHA